jgi:hypothetical protein
MIHGQKNMADKNMKDDFAGTVCHDIRELRKYALS